MSASINNNHKLIKLLNLSLLKGVHGYNVALRINLSLGQEFMGGGV